MDKAAMADLAELRDWLREIAETSRQRASTFKVPPRPGIVRAIEKTAARYDRWADAVEEAAKGLTDVQATLAGEG